ncbi:MAG: hypothetical protein B655_2268 [Methanobacterium sp. Maddingley MBC34]|nr:MAG: hypothetical protein B655_2268 [Methanobacterium sp. Maddingley MBC34]
MEIKHVQHMIRHGEEPSLICFLLSYNYISVNTTDREYECMETQLNQLNWYRNIELINEAFIRICSNIESLLDEDEINRAKKDIIEIIKECYGRNFEEL